jgi:hypothetical protein
LATQLEGLPSKPAEEGNTSSLTDQNATCLLTGINPQREGVEAANSTPDKIMLAMDFGKKEGGDVQTNATSTDEDS